MNVNLQTQASQNTFYGTTTNLSRDLRTSLLSVSILDSELGTPYLLRNSTYPSTRLPFKVSATPTCYWSNNITFMVLTGLPLTTITCSASAPGGKVGWAVDLSISTYTLSSFLINLLPSSADRLFLIINNAQGTLVGASHGKFFSHSDLDLPNSNPLVNP
eukprot:RCo000846